MLQLSKKNMKTNPFEIILSKRKSLTRILNLNQNQTMSKSKNDRIKTICDKKKIVKGLSKKWLKRLLLTAFFLLLTLIELY